ncbi:MAG: LURP-one-related family protein [Myxococcaceae bacterium]|nr:LURP-one-related family protein [Myxococcaceae bacterium]
MRYLVKQKLFCLGDDFAIKDEQGTERYTVDGKAFTLLRQKLAFLDAKKNEVAFIREKLVALTPSYEILRDGKVAAVVKKDFINVFRLGFTVDVPGPDDLEATGSLLEHEYTFRRAGRVVAEVSKRWFSFTDTYGVEVAQGEDDVLILASTVVIDMIAHPDEKAAPKPNP